MEALDLVLKACADGEDDDGDKFQLLIPFNPPANIPPIRIAQNNVEKDQIHGRFRLRGFLPLFFQKIDRLIAGEGGIDSIPLQLKKVRGQVNRVPLVIDDQYFLGNPVFPSSSAFCHDHHCLKLV